MCIGDTAADVTPDFKVEITFWVCLMQRFRKQPPHDITAWISYFTSLWSIKLVVPQLPSGRIYLILVKEYSILIYMYIPLRYHVWIQVRFFFTQLLISQNGKKKVLQQMIWSWRKSDKLEKTEGLNVTICGFYRYCFPMID